MTQNTDPNPMNEPMQKEVDKRGHTLHEVEESMAGSASPDTHKEDASHYNPSI